MEIDALANSLSSLSFELSVGSDPYVTSFRDGQTHFLVTFPDLRLSVNEEMNGDRTARCMEFSFRTELKAEVVLGTYNGFRLKSDEPCLLAGLNKRIFDFYFDSTNIPIFTGPEHFALNTNFVRGNLPSRFFNSESAPSFLDREQILFSLRPLFEESVKIFLEKRERSIQILKRKQKIGHILSDFEGLTNLKGQLTSKDGKVRYGIIESIAPGSINKIQQDLSIDVWRIMEEDRLYWKLFLFINPGRPELLNSFKSLTSGLQSYTPLAQK